MGAYLKPGTLPMRMPLYIAMVALARHLVLDMKEDHRNGDHRHLRCHSNPRDRSIVDPLRPCAFPL
nr:phosphate-starvation-inducible PsiE family protein [Thiocapsa sp.]